MHQLISWRAFANRLDTSVSTAKRLHAEDPEFPRKVRISRGRIGFFDHEADAYIASRKRAEEEAA